MSDTIIETDIVLANLLDIFVRREPTLLPQFAEADVARWYNDLTPRELLDGLRSLGCTVRRHGPDTLAVRDPQQALTHRLRQAIKRRKSELLTLLDAESGPQPLTRDYPCTVCGQADRWQDADVWCCRQCWPPSMPNPAPPRRPQGDPDARDPQ
jgi:hypothetical protein